MLAVRVPTLLWPVGYVLTTVQPSSADKFTPILQPRMRRRVVSALIHSLIATLPPPHRPPFPVPFGFQVFSNGDYMVKWKDRKDPQRTHPNDARSFY